VRDRVRVHVKICGIRDVRSAAAAVEAGADAIGFVLTESVRRVTLEEAAAIAERLPRPVERVAVLARPDSAEVEAVVARLAPDLIQADHDTLVAQHGVGLLPVFRESPGVEDEVAVHLGVNGRTRFVYEGPRSGAGKTVDWARARGLGRRGRMTLAGGLTPDNVGMAIRAARPFGVDVSSGVESRPGVKDPGRIRDFVAVVREVEGGEA